MADDQMDMLPSGSSGPEHTEPPIQDPSPAEDQTTGSPEQSGPAPPPGPVPEAVATSVFLVPIDLVRDSRYRTILPYARDSKRLQAAIQAVLRNGQEPLPARLADGLYEILGHELLHDALRAMMVDSILIRLVEPSSEADAYVHGRGEGDKHGSRPSHWELMRDVRRTRDLVGEGVTWTDIGVRLGYGKSTISHAQRDEARITTAVVERAGVDESDPEHAERLRALGGKRLRWVAAGETEEDRAIRLSLLVHGTAPEGATEEQITANTEQQTAPAVRARKSRNGRVTAVAELLVDGASELDVKAHLRAYREFIRSLLRETQQGDLDESEAAA